VAVVIFDSSKLKIARSRRHRTASVADLFTLEALTF
jgi:hypothetical protein